MEPHILTVKVMNYFHLDFFQKGDLIPIIISYKVHTRPRSD